MQRENVSKVWCQNGKKHIQEYTVEDNFNQLAILGAAVIVVSVIALALGVWLSLPV